MVSTNLFKTAMVAVLMTTVIFSSCKKEDSIQEPQTASPQITAYKNGDDLTRFEYNTDGTLNKVILKSDPVTTDENVTYTAKYLANKVLDEFSGSNGATIKLNYANSILSKSEVFMGGNKISETVFSYTNNKLISTVISVFDINSNVGVPFFKSDFTYNAAGNVSKANMFLLNPLDNQFQAAGYVNSQYDNKNNPFASLGNALLVFWHYAAKNNAIKEEYFGADGSAAEVVETTYTYNTQGYPVSAIVKETQPGGQPTTSALTFTYK